MLYLFLVSLVWAFSFGLIKTNLSSVDSNLVAAIRLGISLIVFVPFFRARAVDRRTAARLLLSGAVQYGGMYIAYLYAFHFLKAYEVALFTVFTPLYVTLADDLLRRRMQWISLGAVTLAVAGTWLVQGGQGMQWGALTGFLVVQASNLCFAFGQIYYRHILTGRKDADGRSISDRQVFAMPYLGGFAAAALSTAVFTRWNAVSISEPQWLTLLYLGAIASGLCFFLWNVGARRVDAGTLAIFNDLKIPLAVIVSLVFFGEQANLLNLTVGGGLAALALLLNQWGVRREARKEFLTLSPLSQRER